MEFPFNVQHKVKLHRYSVNNISASEVSNYIGPHRNWVFTVVFLDTKYYMLYKCEVHQTTNITKKNPNELDLWQS